MKYRIRIPKKMDLEVTWIHHWKKNGKSSTLTRPFRARAVQGLSGLALLNVDPEWRSGKIVTAEGTGRLSFPILIWIPGQSKCVGQNQPFCIPTGEPHLSPNQHRWGPAWCNTPFLVCCSNPEINGIIKDHKSTVWCFTCTETWQVPTFRSACSKDFSHTCWS